jgi:siroheme synthase
VAAPAYAGIPLTNRGLASSFAVVTANLAGGEPQDLRRLATAVDTLVVLMAAERLAEVCTSLVEAGRPADQPAALIEWATTSRQRSVVGALGTLPELARAAGIGPPATLVIGRVVSLSEELGWFEEQGWGEAAEAVR